jgi:hypothetical protein
MAHGILTPTTDHDTRFTTIDCHVDGVLVARARQNYQGWWVDDIDIEETPPQRFYTRAEAAAALEQLAAAWAMLP